jgi:SOS-response transcriptional repressor LexA
MLIVDRDAIPNDDQLVIISANEELIISRYDQDVNSISHEPSNCTQSQAIKLSIWGTVTYVISKQA